MNPATRRDAPVQLRSPNGIAVDAAGRVYVADTNNHRIVRINDMSGTGWTELK